MDISEILSQAKKNQKQSTTVNRYSTDVKPAKKLSRSVNPSAIKAFLDRKKQEEVSNAVEAKKKKEDLQKLRDDSKTTKKANSMAKRTKDNLKVYKGEDVLGLYPDPKKKRRRGSPLLAPLSPEQERKYKAFIKHVVPKVKVSGVNDDESDDEYKEPVLEQDERKIRKMEKHRAKARSASNLEFSDLLQLAEKQKNKTEQSSSSEDESDSGQESDGSTDKYGRPLTAEEKYQRERRKRRELEERLKMASSMKLPSRSGESESKPKSLANFKIGKLNSGLSERDRMAKVKALMAKFKKSNDEKVSPTTTPKSTKRLEKERSKPVHKSHSMTSLSPREKRPEKSINSKHKSNGVKGESSKGHSQSATRPMKSSGTASISKMQFKQNSAISPHKAKFKPSRPSSDSEMRQTKIDGHLRPKKKGAEWDRKSPQPSKKPDIKQTSNPYKHTVVKQSATKRPAEVLTDPWAKTQKDVTKKSKPSVPPAKCTLSVTSEKVRTNCPDMAQEDPYILAYKKTGKVLPKLTPEMMAHYKAAMIRKLREEGKIPPRNGKPHPPPRRRPGVIGDDSDDEYDSDLEGFIVDGEEEIEEDLDVSSQIKAIFGYDKSKYGRESEWELSRMDASYKDIEREEKRSLRIAKEEDAREAKLEEERMKRMQKGRR